jgi:hypothetical protein
MSNEFFLLLTLYHFQLLILKFENPFLSCLRFSLILFTLTELLEHFLFVSHKKISPHVYKNVYCVNTKFI